MVTVYSCHAQEYIEELEFLMEQMDWVHIYLQASEVINLMPIASYLCGVILRQAIWEVMLPVLMVWLSDL